jgi:hypothetical protein
MFDISFFLLNIVFVISCLSYRGFSLENFGDRGPRPFWEMPTGLGESLGVRKVENEYSADQEETNEGERIMRCDPTPKE